MMENQELYKTRKYQVIQTTFSSFLYSPKHFHRPNGYKTSMWFLQDQFLSLHLSLLTPAFKLGAWGWWLLIIISTLATESSLSQYGTFFWQTLHQHPEQGPDPNMKRFHLKCMSGAEANRETGCVQCPVEHTRKQAMNLLTVPGND